MTSTTMDDDTKWMVFFGLSLAGTLIAVVAVICFTRIRIAEIEAGQKVTAPKEASDGE